MTLKQLWFRLRGVEPEAVVVSFLTGPPGLSEDMAQEVRSLLPDRRHFAVEPAPGSWWTLWRHLRTRFRGLRIGMAPMLFHTGPEHKALRIAAFLLAPTKILAYNQRLERHHLHPRCPLASYLFWRGVPLDRIWLRPRWLWPWRKDRTTIPRDFRIVEGRPPSPLRAAAGVLTPHFPYPLAHGGAVRMFNLLREAARDYDITLFSFVEEEAEHGPLLAFCARLILVPKPRYREPRWSTLLPPDVGEYRSPVMERLLREHAPALLQVEYTQLAPYGRQILVEHDVTFDLYRQIHERARTLSSWWDWWRWRRFERRALTAYDAAVVMSKKDAVLTGHPKAHVIANGVDLARYHPAPEPRGRKLLFIGSFRHFPNRVAYRFLIEEVWPRITDAELTVVTGPDAELHWGGAIAAPERTRLLGFVADVRPLYEQANLVLVPTLESAGTNIKVLEAMAMRRAVVSTSTGCAGLGLAHGESIWIADGADAFVGGVLGLLNDDALRARIAAHARRQAEEHYSWKKLGALQRDLWARYQAPPLRVEQGTRQHLEGIARIQSASPGSARWTPEDYLAHGLLVAVHEHEPVGFAVVRQTAAGEHELLDMAVDPRWRRRGVGRRLMEAAIEQFPGEMFLEVRESNKSARGLYEQAGFELAGRRPEYYRNPDEAGIVMRLRTC